MKKINRIMTKWPHGAVMPQAWLTKNGLPAGEAARYAERGGLVRVGHGAYARPGDKLNWEGAVYGMQYGGGANEPPFWPGGATALSLAGYSHYLPMSRDSLWLFGLPGRRLPTWFQHHDWGAKLNVHQVKLFIEMPEGGLEPYAPPGRDYTLSVSTPEMAALEWLHVTTDDRLFSNGVIDTFSGLANLRPGRLQSLLEACRPVRTKRVFLLLARNAKHAWYSRLDTSRMSLGSGRRQLAKGGKLDKEFDLIVPESVANAV